MLIYKNNNKYYLYIHIPKNGGKYIRTQILNNKKNMLVKSYWNISNNHDLAHIPYVKMKNYINQYVNHKYFTYSRNPYDRIISAYLYKNNTETNEDINNFIKNILPRFNFNMDYDCQIIHFFPQYFFVCDETMKVSKNIKIEKLEEKYNPKRYDWELYLDKESIAVVNRIYRNDFLYFGYDFIEITSTEDNP
jgi:hypothetical protein